MRAPQSSSIRPGGAELIRERAAFERLYESNRKLVLSYALRRVEREEAKDVLADTFMTAWRSVEEIPEDARPWLLGVARRVISTRRRSQGRTQALHTKLLLSAARTTFSDPSEEVAAKLSMLEALNSLSERDQEALMLDAWDGLDARQAATVMGCSPSVYGMRLHRARKRLLNRMTDGSEPAGRSDKATMLSKEKRV